MSIFTGQSTPWVFLGQGTASTAVRTTLVSWVGAYKQLLFEYYIAGYSGSAIGRLIVGPATGLSETGTTFCNQIIENVTINATPSISIPGWPTAATAGAVRRHGWMFVKNVAAEIKSMSGHGNFGGTAATTVPTSTRFAGLFSDATNSIQQAELAVYAAVTGTAISTTTFNAGTYVNCWGRNDN